MKIARLLGFFVLGSTLAACGSSKLTASKISDVANAKSQPTSTQALAIQATATQIKTNSYDLVRTDNQGAIEFAIQPINLDNPGDALVFEVSMNTHSVDLSMDIAALASLSTDNGYSVHATSWDGAQGGHHVSGNLTFPTKNNGKPILNGANELTITIKDVDAVERVFSWDLSQ